MDEMAKTEPEVREARKVRYSFQSPTLAATIRPDWFPHWKACAIVGSGPSVKDAPLELLRGRIPVVAINTSYQLVPWADMIYAVDDRWWRLYGDGLRDYAGLKVSRDSNTCEVYNLKHIKVIRGSNILMMQEMGVVGGGANSGFQALNLMVQCGVKLILLIGFDMRLDHGDHWHGRHPPPLSNPSLEIVMRWRVAMDGAAIPLKQLGVTVLNCSIASMLRNYPKMTLPEALEKIDAVHS